MCKLFIIGNGFDLFHGIPTKYEDFKEYLQMQYPDAIDKEFNVPTVEIGHRGDIEFDIDEVVSYLIDLISRTEGTLWKNLEKSLGELNFNYDFYCLPNMYDKDGDRNLWHEAYNNEDLSENLASIVPVILELFYNWIQTIDITKHKASPEVKSLIDAKKDYFISFNYTRTLEELYGVKDVCHIHGVQGGEEKIFFGHGAGFRFDENNTSKYTGCESGLEKIQNALRKDTEGALREHKNFFEKLGKSISSIYSYGFSFGEVDLIYLKEIFKIVNTKETTFYLHNYDKTLHSTNKRIICNCGFHGVFNTFG